MSLLGADMACLWVSLGRVIGGDMAGSWVPAESTNLLWIGPKVGIH